ncbi:MAG: DegV family protein [Butyribacter sp.]|nr:DegV family protein [bacterium]MDY3855129.1 DegV family protein [Butyribacter sp.]
MQKDYVIVTDSTANLPEEMIEKYGVEVLSLNYYVDGKEYKGYEKGKKMDLSAFYDMMREKKEITTSLVNLQEAEELFERLLSAGNNIFYIGFSSGLSGTYQALEMVLDEMREKYPEQAIYSVDSLAAALGEGLLVYHALQNREKGMSLEENVQWVTDNRLHLCHWFSVDDLFFLKRGGRISSTTAIVGTALNIKPVLHVDDEGHLIAVSNVRGRKKALDALVKHMEETISQDKDQPVYISHGDCLEDAEYLVDRINKKLSIDKENIMVGILDPVIGSHSGPGTIAVFFLGTER